MPEPDEILGRWTHSFEEDHDGVTVYRREGYPFPPARGRRGVEFRPDGTFIEWAIGRGDAPEARIGHWDPSGTITRRDGATARFRVVRVETDRLELEWTDG